MYSPSGCKALLIRVQVFGVVAVLSLFLLRYEVVSCCHVIMYLCYQLFSCFAEDLLIYSQLWFLSVLITVCVVIIS